MAEGIFNAKELLDHHARSAGIAAINGSPASVYAGELCRRVGKRIHYAKQLAEEDVLWADLILTMTYTHKQKIKQVYGEQPSVFTLKEFVGSTNMDVQDPFGQERDVYEQTFKEIEEAVNTLIKKIR